MASEHAHFVETLMAAVKAGHAEDLMKHFHRDAIIHEPHSLPYGGSHRGIDGIGRLFAQVNSYFELTVQRYQVFDCDTHVILRTHFGFKSRVTGRAVIMPVVEILEFTEGLISSNDVFYKDSKLISELAAPDR